MKIAILSSIMLAMYPLIFNNLDMDVFFKDLSYMILIPGCMLISGICVFFVMKIRTRRLKGRVGELTSRVRNCMSELKKRRQQLINSISMAGKAASLNPLLLDLDSRLKEVGEVSEGILEILKNSKYLQLIKANALWDENKESLEDFIQEKGRKLFDYYLLMGREWEEECTAVCSQQLKLHERLEEIRTTLIQGGKFSNDAFVLEKLEILPLIKDAQQILEDEFYQSQITLLNQLDKGEQIFIGGHYIKVLHILLSFYYRAIGELKQVQSRCIRTKLHIEEAGVLLIISDNGRIFKEDEIEDLFKPTPLESSGAGLLPLSVCSEYMHHMKGRINAASNGEQGGVTFFLRWRTI